MMPAGAIPTLPSRHLGLVAADQSSLSAQGFDGLADACRTHLDIPALVELARSAGQLDAGSHEPLRQDASLALPRKIRLGIARDAAFHFYYADNLEALAEGGADLTPFSPLADTRLPEDLDGLYLGGGYPEIYAARLAENAVLLAEIRRFAASGRVVYAECGGLMYLGQAVTTLDGVRYPLAGVLPIETTVRNRLNVLGYTEVTLKEESLWGSRGATFHGHEFHYSELLQSLPIDSGWDRVYSVDRRSGDSVTAEGFQKGCILASYVHGAFCVASRTGAAFPGPLRRPTMSTRRIAAFCIAAILVAGDLVSLSGAFRHAVPADPTPQSQTSAAGDLRIVSLSPSVTEMLFVLGLGKSIVGGDRPLATIQPRQNGSIASAGLASRVLKSCSPFRPT